MRPLATGTAIAPDFGQGTSEVKEIFIGKPLVLGFAPGRRDIDSPGCLPISARPADCQCLSGPWPHLLLAIQTPRGRLPALGFARMAKLPLRDPHGKANARGTMS